MAAPTCSKNAGRLLGRAGDLSQVLRFPAFSDRDYAGPDISELWSVFADRGIKANEEERQLRITHEAIPALKWPGMTMAFKVAPGVSLEGLGPGAKVTFTLSKTPQGGYLIEQIKRMQ